MNDRCLRAEEQIKQIKIGNLAIGLPFPLFNFGQTIIDKDQVILYETGYPAVGENFSNFLSFTGLLWGITDYAALFFQIPTFTQNNAGTTTHGLGDLFLQLEYAVHQSHKPTRTDQITIVGAILLPTGPSQDEPARGFGGGSVFIGTTASITHIDWFLFADLGTELTFTHNNSKIGDFFLYEWGIGHNLGYLNDKVFALIVEFEGLFARQDIINGIADPNSGGHTIFSGPVLYFANEKIYLQVGMQFPLLQSLNGSQSEYNYRAGFRVGWTF